jgi:hypothetical protein
MALELIEKTIDGKKYGFALLNASQGLKYAARILKIVAEPMALASGAVKPKKKSASIVEGDDLADDKQSLLERLDPQLLGSAARALCEKLDEDVVLDIVETLCAKNALCDGKQINFNQHYEGKLGHLLSVLSSALEVQFGDFFGGAPAGAVAVVTAIRNAST